MRSQQGQRTTAIAAEIRELELYDYLAKPRTERAFMLSIHKVLNRWGFTDFGFLLIRSAEDLYKTWVYPEKSRHAYIEGRLHHHDLCVRHSLRSDQPVFQGDINRFISQAPVEDEMVAANREIASLLEAQGFKDHCAIAFDSPDDSRALFSFAIKGASSEYFRRTAAPQLEKVHCLARAIQHVGAQKHRMTYMHRRGQGIITNAPLRLLDVLANDDFKKLEDAAAYLNISIGTANSHVRAIKEAFGVPTVARAVAEALHRGIIAKRDNKI